MSIKNKTTLRIAICSILLATGYLLPFLTGQIQQIGNMLLPMHLPVMICGFLLGFKYGAVLGFVLPITRSLFFGMPLLFPSAVAMAFELATYGAVVGLLYPRLKINFVAAIYVSLLSAMILGRLIWGVAMLALLGVKGGAFTFSQFTAGAFLNAIPGIILQLVLVPSIMTALIKTGVLKSLKN